MDTGSPILAGQPKGGIEFLATIAGDQPKLSQCNCSIFSGWRDQPRDRFSRCSLYQSAPPTMSEDQTFFEKQVIVASGKRRRPPLGDEPSSADAICAIVQ